MKKKRLRPLSTKSGQKKFAKSRQKWWPIIILAALLIGYLVWKNNSPDAEKPPIKSTTPTADSIEQDNAAQSDTTSLDDDELTLDSVSSTSTDSQTPDPDTILNAPLPENDSLAKEEIDRLEDERQHLAEQEKLAAEQLAMNKQLTEMKEEQIAQLEAAESAKNSVK